MPVETTLTVIVEKVSKDLTIDEVERLSETFVFADLKAGTGHLRY
jgi:hypothetical protein